MSHWVKNRGINLLCVEGNRTRDVTITISLPEPLEQGPILCTYYVKIFLKVFFRIFRILRKNLFHSIGPRVATHNYITFQVKTGRIHKPFYAIFFLIKKEWLI